VARGGIEPLTYRLTGGLRPSRGAKARNSGTCWTCSWGRTPATTVWLTSAPAPRDMARHRGHHMASTLSLPPAAEPLRASQRDLAACGQLPRAPRGSNQRRRLRREPVL